MAHFLGMEQPLGPALPYILYDQFVLDPPNGPRCVGFGSSWADFINNRNPVLQVDNTTVGAGNIPDLPGEQYVGFFYLASEVGKNAARSLLWNLKMMEDDGYCLVGLVEDNVRVFNSGVVLFRNVQLETKLVLGEQVYLDHLEANYHSAEVLLRMMFSDNGLGTIPDDIQHLLDLLQNNFADRPVFPIHASLAPLINHSHVFKEFHDMFLNDMDDADYFTICEAVIADLRVFGVNDWRHGVGQNQLLARTYNFRRGNDYRLPPLGGPTRAALVGMGVITWNDPTPVNGDDILDGHKMFIFLRNRLAHRIEALKAWNHLQLSFDAIHTERVVLVKFQRVLSVIQINLYQLGYLTPDVLYHLRMLFNIGPVTTSFNNE
ncbi:unnamed protein product [Urochloa decumbens]|uniref:Uncharacterized protein n=1 Tax=Urochloa decumbens TaxID=240449 RepID=A0ABC9ENK7_9POAL